MALLSGSPAIDSALPAFCPPTDQRGVTRPDQPGTACDVGAYEFVVRLRPPHNTQIYKRKINKKKHTATFWFRATGKVQGFQCELRGYVARKHRFPNGKWRRCTSPSSYANVKHGRYLLEVRAYNASGPDRKPATTTFRI